MAEPLRQPRELLELDRRPHPRGDELRDLLQLLLEGVGALLHNQRLIYRLLSTVDQKEDTEMADLKALQAAVAAESTVVDSVVVLVQNLLQEIQANKTDPVAIQALVDEATADTQKLAQAVASGTTPPTP